MVVSRYAMVLWSADNGQGIYIGNLELIKVFRGTGGMCRIAEEEEFPSVFTSAVCRASGGAWSGGHDLVCPYDINAYNSERSYIPTYSCLLISMVGTSAADLIF